MLINRELLDMLKSEDEPTLADLADWSHRNGFSLHLETFPLQSVEDEDEADDA